MKTKILSSIMLGFLLIVGAAFASGPSKMVKLDPAKSTIIVSGTSTMHDWFTKLTKSDGDISLTLDDDKLIKSIEAANLNFYSKSFSSGKSSMDKKTFDALKADKHAAINFKMSEVKEIKLVNKKQQITVTGKLTIAGVTKTVDLTANAVVNANGSISMEIKKEIDMTEYGIAPPEVLFIKAGKKVTVLFSILLN